MNILKFIISIVVITGALFLLITSFGELKDKPKSEQSTPVETSPLEEDIVLNANIDNSAKREAKRGPVYVIKESSDYEGEFESLISDDVSEFKPHRSNVKPLLAFKTSKDSIKKLFIGDSISLPEINEISYNARVNNRKINKNGSVTVKASLEGEDKRFYSVMTQDDNSTYITLVSPEGTFELEAHGSYGYVYSSSDINNSMIDYSKTDAILPNLDNKQY